MRLALLFSLMFLLSCHNRVFFKSIGQEHSRLAGFLSGTTHKEDFILREKQSLIDILISADTSASMFHHLNQLGHSLSDLLSVISHYHWQIGITSADHGDHENPLGQQESWREHVSQTGRFGGLMNLEDGNHILSLKILTPKVENYEHIFGQSLSHSSFGDCHRPPYCHPPLEQPLRSLKSAMERAWLDNKSFFRPQADLISLIITNEEERAENRARATSPEQVVRTFNKIFGHLNKKFIAFNILILDEGCLAVERETAPMAGIAHSVAQLADLTGGYNISICEDNYGRALRNLSQYIKNSVENSVLLAKDPIPETVRVEFTQGQPLKWRQYGRNIIFEKRGSRPIHISVSYQSQN